MANRQTIIPIRSSNISDSKPFIAVGYILVFALCIPLFFIGLGCPPLIDPDEPVYAATGRTMLLSHRFADWWSPHYNGALWFDKPPMTYWLIGLSMKAFGPTALAARIPSAICALLLTALTVYLANRFWPRTVSAGIWAAAAIATSLQTLVLARAAVTDMILAVFLTTAVIGMWNWLNDERETGWLLAAGMATGLATLTKGPVAIVLVGGCVLFFLLLTRQASRILTPSLWLSLLISIVIALPWYLSMIHLHGSMFITGFLEANNLTRYLKPEHPQTSSALWFLPVLLGFIFPWTAPLLLSLKSAWGASVKGDRASLFALVWIAWVFIFFSASQTKLLTYIYPLYPLAACLIGRWIDEEPTRNGRVACGIVFAIVAALIAVILPGYVSRGNGLTSARSVLEQIDLVFAVSAVLALVSLTKFFDTQHLRRQAVFAVPVAAMALFFPLVALASVWKHDLPDLALIQMAGYIKDQTPPNRPTIALGLKRQSLVFYSSRPIIFTDDRQAAANYMKASPYPFCALKISNNEDVLGELEKYLPPDHCKIVLHSGLKYVLIKYQP